MNQQEINFKTNLQNNIGLIKGGVWNGSSISMFFGGTGAKLVPSQGGVVITSDKNMTILPIGSIGQLLSVSGEGLPTWATLNDLVTRTGEVTKTGNNTIVTNSAVIAKVLTGYTKSSGAIVSTDTILQAIQKLEGNVSTIDGGFPSDNYSNIPTIDGGTP